MPPATESTQETPRRGWSMMYAHILTHRIEFTLWCTRCLTMLFALLYLVPIGRPYHAYYKALLANAATSALRLHQRQPRMTLSMSFVTSILIEDSCHYLIYSLIFMSSTPFTFVLLPIFLFSLIHFASYSLTLLDMVGQNSWWAARLLISLVELQSRNILSLIACTEIILMPFSILLVFMSRAGLFTPFFYYLFLLLRYKSQRNPYTRNMFHEMRVKLEDVAAKDSTPSYLQRIIHSSISVTSYLGLHNPQQQPTNQ